MSDTLKTNNLPEVTIPHAPSLKELQELYKHYKNPHLMKKTYRGAKSNKIICCSAKMFNSNSVC